MKDLAIKKLDDELKGLSSRSMHVRVMKHAVHDALVEFCRQDGEFAQAVYQGGSFSACMAAVAKDAGQSLSDLEAYRRAVRFYFPGADVRFHMSVNLCADVEDRQDTAPAEEPKLLDLFDLM